MWCMSVSCMTEVTVAEMCCSSLSRCVGCYRRLEKSQSSCAPYRLQLEQCLSTDQVPTPELIQGYVKKVSLR